MMVRLKLIFLVLGASLLAASCADPSGHPSAGSNSNWLRGCASDLECGDALACLCNVCTRVCQSGAECSDLPGGACAGPGDASTRSQCGDETLEAGICLERCSAGSCGEGRACVTGTCVTATLPESAFCADVAGGEATGAEDELLQAFQERRVEGGVSCADGSVSERAPSLVLDSRLTCAARVFAQDIVQNGTSTLIDSLGRNTSERMVAAGYVAATSVESFVTVSASASEAVTAMLEAPDPCTGLLSSELVDVGVASVGDTRVVTTASR
jgi:uncharacterized protein YkwD